ncbi:MAG: SDR family oxidoreductase [Actinomycetota bacterium]|nr:3-alpha-hydroxysteroid dehydrogenase [Acidimicrobiaceae bacterium]MEC7874625.1 SDR family oxidoreductase [Actinomycetota bacterium]
MSSLGNSDRLTIVTGSSSGIGHAVCSRLVRAGARVISVDRDDAPGDVDVATHFVCDLSDAAAIQKLVQDLDRQFDAANFASLVNVAGVSGTQTASTVLEVNLLAVRTLSRAVAVRFSAGTSIVNVGSISGNAWQQRLDIHRSLWELDDDQIRDWWRDRSRSVGVDPYSFSKEAVIVWSMLHAGELLGTGIRCNVVSPGPVETPLLPAFREQIGDERIDWVLSHSGRAATPDEIAETIEWLAIGQSRWVNGHHLVVDGGYTSGVLSGWVDLENAPTPKVTYVE